MSLLGRILPSSVGNTSGGIVSAPDSSIEAFSDEFAGAAVDVNVAVCFLETVPFDASAGVISISCDDGISAADKNTVNRKLNVVFYQSAC